MCDAIALMTSEYISRSSLVTAAAAHTVSIQHHLKAHYITIFCLLLLLLLFIYLFIYYAEAAKQ